MKAVVSSLHIFALVLLPRMTKSSCLSEITERQKYEFDCTRYWETTYLKILECEFLLEEELKCCPEESSFLEETGECDGPPSWCRPDCFGCFNNTLMEWSEWEPWSKVYTGYSIFVEERYRYLKNCQNRQNYHPVKERQEQRIRKRGKRMLGLGSPDIAALKNCYQNF